MFTGESNVYTLGNIGAHRIVCTKLPSVGHTREAMTAAGNTTTRLLGKNSLHLKNVKVKINTESTKGKVIGGQKKRNKLTKTSCSKFLRYT